MDTKFASQKFLKRGKVSPTQFLSLVLMFLWIGLLVQLYDVAAQALAHALSAYSATITVDGTTCTLAEAIDAANNDDAAGNGCADGNGADTIDLQTDVTL